MQWLDSDAFRHDKNRCTHFLPFFSLSHKNKTQYICVCRVHCCTAVKDNKDTLLNLQNFYGLVTYEPAAVGNTEILQNNANSTHNAPVSVEGTVIICIILQVLGAGAEYPWDITGTQVHRYILIWPFRRKWGGARSSGFEPMLYPGNEIKCKTL